MTRELGLRQRLGAIAIALMALMLLGPLSVLAEMLPSGSMPPQVPALRGKIIHTGYLLGPGDILTVKDEVMDNEAARVTILSDGTANLKLVGRVLLVGITLEQAQDVLNEAYSQYYVNPSISVALAFQRPVRVYVTGAVGAPGIYDSGKSLNPENLQGSQLGVADPLKLNYRYTLADVLMQAGGLTYNADVSNIQIIRADQQVYHINLWKLFSGEGDTDQDFELRDKDTIKVSEIPAEQLIVDKKWEDFMRGNLGQNEFRVTVLGEVEHPGTYTVKNTENALSAIAQAGGFKELADRKKVYVLRKNSNGQVFGREISLADKKLMVKKPLDEIARLLPGDIVVVDNSKAKQFGKGAVAFARQASSSATFVLMSQIIRQYFEDSD